MLSRKLKTFGLVLLACTMFFGMAAVAAAADYELDRIDLYDYYDDDSRIRITEDDIESNMEQTVDWRRVRIVPRTVDGTYKITGEVGQDSDDNYYVTLDEDETIRVTISVYDDDDKRQKRYYLDLTRGMEGIESVLFTGDDFEKSFTSLDDENDLLIPEDESSIRLKVYLANDDYTVECNDSGSGNNAWNIKVPKNDDVTVYLRVYNEDEEEVAEYKFTIERSADAKGDNDDDDEKLTDLEVKTSDGKYDLFPKFDPDVHEYYVCLPKDEKTAVIIPTYGDEIETLKINGKTVRSGNESNDLSAGTDGKAYTVKVTEEDGDVEEYTVNLLRAVNTDGDSSTLDNLRIKRGTGKSVSSMTEIESEPDFDSYTKSYELIAGDDSAYFSFRPSLEDSDSVVLLHYDDEVVMLEDDEYCSAVELEADDVATIRVYSPNFEEYTDYKFDVLDKQLDDNCRLDDLELYVDGVEVALSPEFAGKTYTYLATVGKNADVFTVKADPESDDATITVNGDEVKNDKHSEEYSLNTGMTSVTVKVTAANGEDETYRITITRSDSVVDKPATDKPAVNGDPIKVVLRIGSTNYIVNGKSHSLAAAPYITSSRTQVPLRVIAEALGANVNYNNKAKQITINKDGERMYLDIGKKIKDFDVAPEVKASTTFVPIRYVSEKLKCKCQFNNATKEVIITYGVEDGKN